MDNQNLIEMIKKNIQTGIKPSHSSENPHNKLTEDFVKSKKFKVEPVAKLSKFSKLNKKFGGKSLTEPEKDDTMSDHDDEIAHLKALIAKYKGE